MKRKPLRFPEGDGKVDTYEGQSESSMLKKIGWTSLALGVAAIGIYIGSELRQRSKFKRRTPYDYYSHSGDTGPVSDYGVGI
jgi:hypothetical protein